MRPFRLLIAAASLAVLVTVVAAVALAAPTALSPSRSAAAAEYCAPGVKQQRQQAVASARSRVATLTNQATAFRKTQLAARKAYFKRVRKAKLRAAYVKAQNRSYAARLAQLRAAQRTSANAQADLSRCD